MDRHAGTHPFSVKSSSNLNAISCEPLVVAIGVWPTQRHSYMVISSTHGYESEASGIGVSFLDPDFATCPTEC